ncbi:MAG: hypothetical protein IJ196_04755 [Prevotella sp.]|nr:hypothetical protein [Prevotella sp.]
MTYNQSAYITDAMNGFCMQQTTFPFLAIICDDASTDGEQDVIRQYLDQHFQVEVEEGRSEWTTDEAHFVYAHHRTNPNCYFLVIFLKENYYSQRKDKAHLWAEWDIDVKYIALCEGDDYWTAAEKLERQVGVLENNENVAFCVHDYTEWIQNKSSYRPHELNIKFEGDGIILSMDSYLREHFFTKILTTMYKADALNKSKYTEYDVKIDMMLYFALFTQGCCYLMKDNMGCYRIHDGGVYSGSNRQPLQNRFFSNIFSLCRIERTRAAQKFVYNFIAPYAISELLRRKMSFVKDCLSYLGIYNVKLFFIKYPQLILSILLAKLGVRIHTGYLRF